MNIVEPYARVLAIDGKWLYDYKHTDADVMATGTDALKKIEWCGRISHRSEETQTEDSWERFIKAVVLGHGDWSIVEHASATVDMLVDRGITHELVRHRLFSFTQESTRFVNYEKKMPPSFILPNDIKSEHEADENIHLNGIWTDAIDQAELAYRALLNAGATPQIARSVFPNALASRIIVTGNLRNWRHILLLRTTRESHPKCAKL